MCRLFFVKGWPTPSLEPLLAYKIRASNGHENAIELRDLLAQKMTSADISEAQKLARECVAKNYKGC